jgi:hypothetical protein
LFFEEFSDTETKLAVVQLFRCISGFKVPTKTAANPVASLSATSPLQHNFQKKCFFAQVMGLI